MNKLNTKVTLRWPLAEASLPDDVLERFRGRFRRRINQADELLITSQRFRDQGRNVADCLNKLREMVLTVATPPRARRPTKPTRASRERRSREKRRLSEKKQNRRRPRLDD